MGLELAELVIHIEEEFGLSFSDEAAQNCRTVGDVVAFVQAGLAERAAYFCWTGHAFRELREVLVLEAGVPRAGLRPSTPLREALPRSKRLRAWPKLAERLSRQRLDLPGLRLSVVGCAILLFACLVALGYWLGLVPPAWPHSGWLRALVALAAFVAVFKGTTRIFCSRFPARCETVGDLARAIALVPAPGEVAASLPASDEVQAKVIKLVSECLLVPVEEISLSSRFVEDLKAG